MIILFLSIAYYTLFERKLLRYRQRRVGPNKISGIGILQPVLDGVKLLMKEYTLPFQVLAMGFFLIPALSFPLIIVRWLFVKEENTTFSSSLSGLFLLRIFSLAIYGTMLTGILSSSKFGYLGGLRASAQRVSYEIILSLILFVYLTLKKSIIWENLTIIEWVIIPIWSIILIRETNRAPFDFAEGERELISGFNTEFRSSLFVLLFLREYGRMLALSFLSGRIIGFPLLGSIFFSSGLILLRACFPRFRFDILIGVCWLLLLPWRISIIIIILILRELS